MLAAEAPPSTQEGRKEQEKLQHALATLRTLKESSWKFPTAHLFKFHWPVLGAENIYMGSIHH